MLTYRKELLLHKDKLPFFISVSLIGGTIGALILLNISNVAFSFIVPYLLLCATVLFTFRTRLIAIIRKFSNHSEDTQASGWYRILMVILFFGVAVYGGFFGAGMGILLLALFGLMGMHNLHEMNALRSCAGLCANVIAIIIFGVSGNIVWMDAMVMAIGGIFGGYLGAYYALKLPQSWTRTVVVVIGWGMTIYFFCK